jgi:peptidoglycan-N-acetylglucosamine deacetylase
LDQILEALDRAKCDGALLILLGHNISENGPGHHIRPEKLEAILRHGKDIGLRFYTFDELP